MKCPTLAELPAPPAGKTGWPWTEASEPAPATAEPPPKISIVTTSYMQGQFLEETIRSVLLQGYPDIEYIIVDGGSRDESVSIIKKYAPWIAWWCSEKDAGQPDALNKGMDRTTGKIVAFINSDDWYNPGAFTTIGRRALAHPEEDWWVGQMDEVTGDVRARKISSFKSLALFLGRVETLYQPSVFWTSRMLKAAPHFLLELPYGFDHEYWVRVYVMGYRPVFIDPVLANFRMHGQSKTSTSQHYSMRELHRIAAGFREHLTDADWKLIQTKLKDYEADHLLTIVYSLLAQGKRWRAARHLVTNFRLYPHISPPKLIAGAYFRAFIAGSPPEWFRL